MVEGWPPFPRSDWVVFSLDCAASRSPIVHWQLLTILRLIPEGLALGSQVQAKEMRLMFAREIDPNASLVLQVFPQFRTTQPEQQGARALLPIEKVPARAHLLVACICSHPVRSSVSARDEKQSSQWKTSQGGVPQIEDLPWSPHGSSLDRWKGKNAAVRWRGLRSRRGQPIVRFPRPIKEIENPHASDGLILLEERCRTGHARFLLHSSDRLQSHISLLRNSNALAQELLTVKVLLLSVNDLLVHARGCAPAKTAAYGAAKGAHVARLKLLQSPPRLAGVLFGSGADVVIALR
jgi:hypothetical protein